MAKSDHRQQAVSFARTHGLEAKGSRISARAGGGLVVTLFDPKSKWLDCFDSWAETYDFLLKARDAFQLRDQPYPWDRKRAGRAA